MFDGKITLWTIHSDDFSITSGEVDHDKSEHYRKNPHVRKAYHELWRRLSIIDGQIVWCFTKYNSDRERWKGKIMKELQIPREKVLRFLDRSVWERIVGWPPAYGRIRVQGWINEAPKGYSGGPSSYVEKCRQDFLNQKPKTGYWWDELFVEETVKRADAIIDHPVPDNFVKNKTPL